MDDFILSITKNPSGFIITAPGGEQVALAPGSLPLLSSAESGRWLYQRIFSGPILARYQEREPDRLLLYLPFELLDWPWQMLHDGSLPLALRHPIVLLSAERQDNPAPALRLEKGPLRVLLTLALDAEHAALGAAIEQIIETFEQRHAGRVLVSKESYALDSRRLLRVFQGAQAPFHLWHHVGPCEPGFALKLADAAPEARNLNFLLDLQPGLRGFVLSTHQAAPAASRLSQLKAPFLLYQSAIPASQPDLSLLQGFYDRMLTHDLAVASTLAQLDKYLAAGEGWSDLTILAQTPGLHLGSPRPVHAFEHQAHAGREQVPVTPVGLLFLKANPRQSRAAQILERLRIDREMKEIKSAIRENSRFFDWQEEGAVRMQDFSGHLTRYRPTLLHFSGHASTAGELAFETYTSLDEVRARTHLSTGLSSEPDLIPFQTIAEILADYQETLSCVVLNACHTEALAEAICSQIDCAIGIRGAINDGLAICFSELFYRALAHGDSVGRAFRKARNEIALRFQSDQAQVFQIKSKPGVDPDTIVFVQTQGDRI